MTCTSPIDINTTDKSVKSITGTFSYKYDVNLLNQSTINTSTDNKYIYVNITSSSNNSNVTFYDTGSYSPYELRIYKPSLHKYNGKHAYAELLIIHIGNNSSNGLVISVPISMENVNQNASLSSLVSLVNSGNRNISNTVDVNTFFPSSNFYVYNGSLPYGSCGGNYYYAVYTTPISISSEIKLAPSEIKTVPFSGLLQKSRTVANTTYKDDYIVVEFLPTDCEEESSSASNTESSSKKKANMKRKMVGMHVLLGILIAIFLWFIFQVIMHLNTRQSVREIQLNQGTIK